MALRISGDGSLNYLDATFNNVTASGLSASGNVVLPSTTEIGSVSSTEIGHIDGVTSGIQSQLNSKANLSAGYQYHSTIYYTSNGTFTKASYPWLRAIRVKVQGGGGSGGSCDYSTLGEAAAATGGGSGAYAESFIDDISSLSSSVTVVVGAGGSSVTGGNSSNNNGSNGNQGGKSSFAEGETYEVSANGGDFGNQGFETGSAYGAAGANPTTTAVGDLVVPGSGTENSLSFGSTAIGGSYLVATPSKGADSVLGSGGTSGIARASGVDLVINGTNGRGYGSGGGGSANTAGSSSANGGTSGAGAPGIVIVELYA